MAKIGNKKNQKRKTGKSAERFTAETIDDVRRFEEFKQSVLPSLRAEISKGTSSEELLAKFSQVAAARILTILATEPDNNKALAAAKEVLDRTLGKAVQKSEATHKFENLKDEQLDALLKSKVTELEAQDGDEEAH